MWLRGSLGLVEFGFCVFDGAPELWRAQLRGRGIGGSLALPWGPSYGREGEAPADLNPAINLAFSN